ncbi:MAG TPA: class I SAM-dependent methyltransferase [Zeimonas sp.]|jgi:SAM-dependent methyltransferase|nr:class I SAM-dependent methyltransferase [Zeimonas sp.]
MRIAYPACPLCEAESLPLGAADCTRYPNWHEPLPTSLEWMRCGQCGHVHTRHYWSEAGLVEVFRYAHATQLAGMTENPDAKRAIWLPVVQKVLALLRPHGQSYQAFLAAGAPLWVDVGCGDGALTMTAADFGFDTVGLDARAETVACLRQLGFDARHGDFAKVEFDRQPDVLSMMDVLEHMPYPREALHKAATVLRPGGLIVISLPDLSCSSWRLMDAAQRNPYWMEIEHHHNFSRGRLLALLAECGFEVVDFAIPLRYKAQMEVYARLRGAAVA